mgnify:CR=1 FL=1
MHSRFAVGDFATGLSSHCGKIRRKKGLTEGFARSLYRVIVGQGWVGPSDFWRMPPGEVWWLIAAKTPEQASVADIEELYQLMMEAD